MKRTTSKITSMFLAICLIAGLFVGIPVSVGAASSVWDGISDTSWYTGTDSTYTISTAEQLAGLATLVNNGTSTFAAVTITLGDDIVLNDTTDWVNWGESSTPAHVWVAIGATSNFSGTFDGNGKKVTGVYINNASNYQGLFGHLGTGGTIENVGVESSYIGGGQYVGGIVGDSYCSTITNCYNKGTVTALNGFAGGIAGWISGFSDTTISTITNCYNIGSIVAFDSCVGGIYGYCNGYSKITNCYSAAAVSVSGSAIIGVGGVIGYLSNSSDDHCYWDNTLYTGSGVGHIDNATGINLPSGQTTAQMKAGPFLTSLNDEANALNIAAGAKTYSYWFPDNGSTNNGYPVLGTGYVVTFDNNTGDTPASPAYAIATGGGTVTLPTTDPTKNNFVFAGWYTDKTYTTPFNTSTPVTNDITVYAHWVSKPTVVSSASATSIAITSATVGGNVSSDGGSTLMDRGILYKKDSDPITSYTTQAAGSVSVGSFGVSLGSLQSGTLYDYMAYATNSAGTSYGSVVNFTTLPDNNPTLYNIVLSSGTLSPAFNLSTDTYTATVAGAVSSITVTPYAQAAGAAISVNGGAAIASTQASAGINLARGAITPITLVVTAQDEIAQHTYTINVYRPSNNATLNRIDLSSGTLSPAFASGTNTYTATVGSGVTGITLTPYISTSGSAVTVNGFTVASTTASGNIALTMGTTTSISVVVTAEDGTTTNTYTINVLRQSNCPDLYNIALSSGTLSPAFNLSTDTYTATVAGAVSSITVTPYAQAAGAAISVNGGAAIASTQASTGISLASGTTTPITLVVTAQDGIVQHTYTINVYRPSNNATLNRIDLSSGTLSPAFGSGTNTYAATVGSDVTDITLTPYISTSGSAVTVNGVTVASTTASGNIALAVASTTSISVVVTAEDGTTTNTYTVNVFRPSNDANLSNLTLSSGTLAPDFASATTSYAANVDYTVSSVQVTPTLSQGNASVKVNNVAATSGNASASIGLDVGSNTINVEVTAQDGTTLKTYTITVTRAAAPVVSSSSGGGGGGSAAVILPASPDVQVIVNGVSQAAATTSTETVNNQTVTTVTVDDSKINTTLNSGGSNSTVEIPLSSNSDVNIGQLNGETVKNMETKDAVLEINTGSVSYALPASEINIDNVAAQIGQNVQLQDIKVQVSIAAPSDDTAKIVQDTANKNNYQIVVKPVEFSITCASGGETVDVSKFNGYVERTIAIPDGVDPSKITTGVILNSDGTFSHVPTTVVVIGGKYYAKINSLTNSTYSIISSPKTFADVENHWAKADVNDMASRLVISGVDENNFQPDRDISRAEFAAIIVRGLGLMRTGVGKDTFKDVDSTAWYYDAVSIAADYKLISGYDGGIFAPDKKITREEAMAIAVRAMNIAKLNTSTTAAEMDQILNGFSDSSNVSDWAKASVTACVREGIVSGSGNSLLAQENISRAQTAAIIRRILKKANLI